MSRGCFATLALLYLELWPRAGAAPICAYEQAECHAPSLAHLFDMAIQQSSRMHWISSDLHSQMEQYLFPTKNLIGKWRCHTYEIATPGDKENAQSLGQEQLTEVILRLLGAWGDPLLQLHHSMSQDHNHNQDLSSTKALEMSNMVQELRDGVLKMARRMKLLGMLGNVVGDISLETLAPSSAFSFYKRGELTPLDHNHLLYCFRRDSNKVKNYLRILKCSALPQPDC